MGKTKTMRRHAGGSTAKSKIGWVALSAMLGMLVTVILLLVTALIIKSINPGDGVISVISTIIKIIGAFVTVNMVIRKVDMQPMLLGLISAVVFILLSVVLFIALGGTQFDLRTFFVDILIGAASGVLFGLLLGRKSIYVLKK